MLGHRDGSGVTVSFDGTQVAMTQITFNDDCVPVKYTLTFNGAAVFTPLPPTPPALVVNGVPPENQFTVTFSNLVLTQDARGNPVTVNLSGSMTSDCFGGSIGLQTFAPVAVAAGEICPQSGQLNVTGTGMSMASIVYDDGAVQVTPSGGQPQNYLSCLAPDLLMCEAQ